MLGEKTKYMCPALGVGNSFKMTASGKAGWVGRIFLCSWDSRVHYGSSATGGYGTKVRGNVSRESRDINVHTRTRSCVCDLDD